MKQFAYRDGSGHVYPAHPALAFQPGLVPGHWDSASREFTPIGNPQEQTGNIITDAGAGARGEQVLSGLREDRGAGTAPMNGVAFVQGAQGARADEVLADDLADSQAKAVELEMQVAERDGQIAALRAQLALVQGAPQVQEAGDAMAASMTAQAVRPEPVEGPAQESIQEPSQGGVSTDGDALAVASAQPPAGEAAALSVEPAPVPEPVPAPVPARRGRKPKAVQ